MKHRFKRLRDRQLREKLYDRQERLLQRMFRVTMVTAHGMVAACLPGELLSANRKFFPQRPLLQS